jgi:hypothetical protein
MGIWHLMGPCDVKGDSRTMCAQLVKNGFRATSSINEVECVDCLRAQIREQEALLRQIARLAEAT